MVFFLLGCRLARVAWRHSYVLAAPALTVLAGKAWNGRMNAVEFLSLCCFVPLVVGLLALPSGLPRAETLSF